MAKILNIVSLVVLAVALALGFVNSGKRKTTLADLETTKGQLVAAGQQAKESETAASKAKEELVAEKGKREAAEAELNPVKAKLGEAEAKISALTADVAAKDKEIADLKATPVNPGTTPAPDAAVTDARVKELEAQVAAIEGEKKILAEQAEGLKGEVAALRDAEQKKAQGLMKKGLEGTVLAYNPAWNFVVLNIGDRQGAAAGAELVVARGSTMVGRVKITSVEPSTSIADVVLSSVATGSHIAPGDKVIYPGR